MSEWLTHEGTVATAAYYRAVRSAVVAWWRVHRRRDLPWRHNAEQRAAEAAAAATGQPRRRHARKDATSCSVRLVDYSTPHAQTPPPPPPPPHCYDPYEVWVAEVMSQQTQLGTVVAYFAAWMRRFPTLDALARAHADEVRAAWSGLGYYRRAMYLHKGAQALARRAAAVDSRTDDDNNKNNNTTTTTTTTLPRCAGALRDVPGIGPYTAAAIASVCYGERVVAVDGNVVRVLARLRAERDFDPKKSHNVRRAEAWARQLVQADTHMHCHHPDDGDGDHDKSNYSNNAAAAAASSGSDDDADAAMPGALSQGLMELGASVCRPNAAPRCAQCPLRDLCASYAQWQRGTLPCIEGIVPLRAAPPRKRDERVVCVVHELPPSSSSCAASTRKRRRRRRDSDDDGNKHDDSSDTASVATSHRRFVVLRRPAAGLLGGMLEFPSLTLRASPPPPTPRQHDDVDSDVDDDKRKSSDDTEAAATRLLQLLACGARTPHDGRTAAATTTARAGVPVLRACGRVRHIFSHIDMTIDVYHACWTAPHERHRSAAAAAAALEQRVCARVARALHAGVCEDGSSVVTTTTSDDDDNNVDDGDHETHDALHAIAERVLVVDEATLARSATPRLLHKILRQLTASRVDNTTDCATAATSTTHGSARTRRRSVVACDA